MLHSSSSSSGVEIALARFRLSDRRSGDSLGSFAAVLAIPKSVWLLCFCFMYGLLDEKRLAKFDGGTTSVFGA